MKSKKYPLENWFNKLENKHLIIGFIVWTLIYRIIDSQTLDWFGKSNDANTLVYFILNEKFSYVMKKYDYEVSN